MNTLIEIGYYIGIGIILIFFLYVIFRVIFYSFFKTRSQFYNDYIQRSIQKTKQRTNNGQKIKK